jgi:pimeloyl-ACP methyl ester carboxylesterase/DNA-binding CsgD family transcriptional regulator
LCALFPVWDDRIAAPVQRHFGLTTAELDIVKGLVRGAGLQAIADARGRSIQTVRTQVKSLLAKTGFGSQIDLVRHVAAFRPAPSMQDVLRVGPAGGPSEVQQLKTPGSGKLEYVLIGPEKGSPVLFLHGMIDSPMLSQQCHEILWCRNVRLILPARPHFGGSDGYQQGENPTEACAAQVVRLMDSLDIDRAPVIGHMAGALYAYHLAARHPQRVSRIVSVAGAIPMTEPWQFEHMSTGHRIAGLTARRAPAILPVLVRGGIQLLRHGREAKMLELMFRDSPVDAAFAREPEVRALMLDRFRFVTAQGHRAFEIDVRLVAADWSAFAKTIRLPVGIVHGRHDRVVLIAGVDAFARRAGMPLWVDEEAGQLVWTHRPELVFDMLDYLATATAEAATTEGQADR